MTEDMRNALTALLYQTGEQSHRFVMVLATNRPNDLDTASSHKNENLIHGSEQDTVRSDSIGANNPCFFFSHISCFFFFFSRSTASAVFPSSIVSQRTGFGANEAAKRFGLNFSARRHSRARPISNTGRR